MDVTKPLLFTVPWETYAGGVTALIGSAIVDHRVT